MKEKWTNDLQKKMADYEVPTIPEGLWENIDSALETGVSDKPKEQTTNTQHLTPNTQYWRKVCAAILLLLAIPMTLYLLHDKEDEEIVSKVEMNAPIQEISSHETAVQKDAEAYPTLSKPSTKHLAKAIVKNTTIAAESTINNSSNSAIEEQVQKEENLAQTPPTQKQEEKPSVTKKSAQEEPVSDYSKEEFTISKKKPENRLYLAMNASGTNFSSTDSPYESSQYMNDYNSIGNENPVYNSADQITYHDETHHRPITFGLQVGIPVAEDWSLVTGLTYTYLHSEFTDGTRMGYTLSTDQNLHFIGVPVQMNYQLYNNRYCNIYLGAGGRADFGVSGKTNHESKLSHLPVNYSLKAAAGVQVNLFKSLNIYAEPTIQYNLPGSTRYKTYYTEHKTMLDLQFGIRFTP